MPTDYFVNGSQQISQAIVFDDSRAKAIANMPDGSIRLVSNPGRPSVSEDLVWGASGITFSTPSGVTLGYNTVVSINGQNNLVSNQIAPPATGTNQQLGLYLTMTGGSLLAPGLFRIPLVSRAVTGGSDGLDAANFVVQQNLADPACYLNGLEVTFNNLKRNDLLNPVDVNHYGVTIDVYGGFATGPAALAIRTGAPSSTWQRGVWIPVNTITAGGYAFDYEGNGSGAVRITANGLITIGGTANTGLQFANGATLQDDGTNQLTMKGGSSGFRFLNSAGTTNLFNFSNAGVLTMSQYGGGTGAVTVGALDSGGAGFRLLRVPN